VRASYVISSSISEFNERKANCSGCHGDLQNDWDELTFAGDGWKRGTVSTPLFG
jgi:hypothetical protein